MAPYRFIYKCTVIFYIPMASHMLIYTCTVVCSDVLILFLHAFLFTHAL